MAPAPLTKFPAGYGNIYKPGVPLLLLLLLCRHPLVLHSPAELPELLLLALECLAQGTGAPHQRLRLRDPRSLHPGPDLRYEDGGGEVDVLGYFTDHFILQFPGK
jgi:hypothetical protein